MFLILEAGRSHCAQVHIAAADSAAMQVVLYTAAVSTYIGLLELCVLPAVSLPGSVPLLQISRPVVAIANSIGLSKYTEVVLSVGSPVS